MVEERTFNAVYFAIGLLLSTPTGMIWGEENFVVYSDPEKGNDVGLRATTMVYSKNGNVSKPLKLGHGNHRLSEEHLAQMLARKEISMKNLKSLMPTIIDLFTKSMNAATVFYKSRSMKKSENGGSEQPCQKENVPSKDSCNHAKQESSGCSANQKTSVDSVGEKPCQKAGTHSKESSDSTRLDVTSSVKQTTATQQETSEAQIEEDRPQSTNATTVSVENPNSTRSGAVTPSARHLNATAVHSLDRKELQTLRRNHER